MQTASPTLPFTRRKLLTMGSLGGLFLASAPIAVRPGITAIADGQTEENELIARLTGKSPADSARVRLNMPATFINGHSVPLTLAIESQMNEADHVRHVQVVAPRNPICVVARFQFSPQSGRAEVSTRVRLAESQNVIAAAEMSDGSLLVGRTYVEVMINGCPST
jgi:sulfur-oxidizing protein SoxY